MIDGGAGVGHHGELQDLHFARVLVHGHLAVGGVHGVQHLAHAQGPDGRGGPAGIGKYSLTP